MSSEASKSEAAPEAAPSGGGGGNKLVLILTLVNLLVVVGMVAILFMSFKKESAHPKVEDIAAGDAHGGGGHGEKAAEGGHGEKAAEGGHGGAGEHGGGDKKKGGSEYGKMIPLDQFTVNLTTPGSATPKFVRVNIVVQVKSDDAEAEFKAKEPQVRNTVIDVLNSKRPSDLATSDQRDFLKDELKDAFNKFMTNKVEGVFFTNFALSG